MHLGQAKSGLRERVIEICNFRFHRADTPYKQCHQDSTCQCLLAMQIRMKWMMNVNNINLLI